MGQSLPEIQHQFASFHVQESSSCAERSDCFLTFNTVIRIRLLIYRLLVGFQVGQLICYKINNKKPTSHRSLFSAHSPYSDKRFTTNFHASFVWSLLLLSWIHSASNSLFNVISTSIYLGAKICVTQPLHWQPLNFRSPWGFNAHLPVICCFPPCLEFCPSHCPVTSNKWLSQALCLCFPDVVRE